MSALSNRAKYRARHGLEISLRLSLPDRLSFHAAGGLLDRGYAGLGYASVSRFATSVAVFCAIESILQVILVNVKKILVKGKLLVTHLEVVVMEAGRDSTVEPRTAV